MLLLLEVDPGIAMLAFAAWEIMEWGYSMTSHVFKFRIFPNAFYSAARIDRQNRKYLGGIPGSRPLLPGLRNTFKFTGGLHLNHSPLHLFRDLHVQQCQGVH